MNTVFILWQRNGFVESDWRMLSVYSCSESVKLALENMSTMYPSNRGYEHKTTETRVNP